ncbi:MAG: zinc-dependent alcohol dehydrogenase family protein [Anaerolineales bacterium]|nr:zinc-dependent alcohol dehydrogenase family protein [Anaerolineales bacterium]
MMKAFQLNGTAQAEEKPLELVDLPVPEPGPGQVRLKIKLCGVCHTDLHTIEGDIHPPHMPVVPGHQVVATIDKLGEGVEQVKVGDRVGVPWLYDADGTCEYCRRGLENLCPNARFTGFHMDGGYAEYMLAEAAYVLPLPDSLTDGQAAPLLCAGIIGYRSLRQADLQKGERLGLFGFGASAHLAIQVARHWDCEVYAFTRSQAHRDLAMDLGAAWAGGSEDKPPKPLDRAVIFAPVGEIVPQALAKLRPAGTLAINAIHMSAIPQMPYELVYGERTLRSVANATYQDGVEFLELGAEIPIVSTVQMYAFEDASQALIDLKHSRINGEAVLQIEKQ